MAHEEEAPQSERPKKAKKKSGKKPELRESQWWRAEELNLKPHEILDNLVRQIEDDQEGRREAYREYERMFGSGITDDVMQMLASGTLSQNELANTIETLWAQVFKNKIVPAVCTNEADHDEWERAKSYSRWLEGALDAADVYESAVPMAGIYSLIYGTGPIRVDWEEDWDEEKAAKVTAYAVNPKYLTVDRLEAKHGKPRCLYFKTHVDKAVLHDIYKDDDEDFYGTSTERCHGIDKCTSNDDDDLGLSTTRTKCDMVTVREAWHIPSGPKAGDGKHVIWINGCTLLYREFTWDTFPFVFIRFGCRTEGFWGESAVKRLGPTQQLLDKLNKKIDEAQDIMGVPRIIVRNAANIKVAHIDDIPGGIIQCEDMNGIKEWNAECVQPELYADRDNAPRKMRSLLGVSDFEVQQQIPQGMRDVSGAFLERWVDQGQARHAMFHKEYENAIVKLSYLFMRQAKELEEAGYKLSVMSPGYEHNKSSVEALDFSDVYIDRKRLKLRVMPMSDLPQTFAGKVEAIAKLRNEAGVPVDAKTVMRMIQVPDVSSATDMLVSDEELIMKNLNHMCKTGEFVPPLPFDNHDLIVQMTTRFINHYRIRNDADMDKIGLLAQYIDQALALKKGLGGTDPNAPPSLSTMAALAGQGPAPLPPPGMGPPGPPGMGPPPGPPGVPPPGLGPQMPPPGMPM